MKLVYIGLLILLVSSTINCQYQVDRALELLVELENDTQRSLNELNGQWEENGKLLMENVDSWETGYEAQFNECSSRQQALNQHNAAITENQNFLDWISAKTKETSDRYMAIYKDRCLANRNYIQGLSNDKITLKLIEFLRSAINNYNEGSFIQKKQTMKNIIELISLYKNHNFKQLLQMHSTLNQYVNDNYNVAADKSTGRRSNEDVGTGHIDQQRDDLELEGYESGERKDVSYRLTQMLELLDSLESQIKQKMKQSSEDEMASGIAAAEFRGKLEHELQELDRELYNQVMLKSKLKAKLVELENHSEQCQIELANQKQGLDSARAEYETRFSEYQTKRDSLADELQTFQFVRETYQENVQSQSYQEQVEDVYDDGSLDNSYQNREVDQIDYIENQ